MKLNRRSGNGKSEQVRDPRDRRRHVTRMEFYYSSAGNTMTRWVDVYGPPNLTWLQMFGVAPLEIEEEEIRNREIYRT